MNVRAKACDSRVCDSFARLLIWDVTSNPERDVFWFTHEALDSSNQLEGVVARRARNENHFCAFFNKTDSNALSKPWVWTASQKIELSYGWAHDIDGLPREAPLIIATLLSRRGSLLIRETNAGAAGFAGAAIFRENVVNQLSGRSLSTWDHLQGATLRSEDFWLELQ
jgi:hypothetical protein